MIPKNPMPEKPATVAAYAAGASLAAITLFYVFGPNFTIDGDDSSNSGRKKGIVGLSNPANDCFINSVLQALAGLGELRVYLIRELHRRELEGRELYESLPDPKDVPRGESPEVVRRLQLAPVTKALKDMLDSLNERPIYRKTTSARGFIQALEIAFRTRISRNQQDAHEFLQVVAERLCDEYHAGAKVRKSAAKSLAVHVGVPSTPNSLDTDQEKPEMNGGATIANPEAAAAIDTKLKELDFEYGFPLEGTLESQVECKFCSYQYKPNQTSFVNLTLQVPQKSSTTLSSCFDGLLKTEFIDDFRCDKCQLGFAIEQKTKSMNRLRTKEEVAILQKEIFILRHAFDNDPESPPQGVAMPDPQTVPRRKIARHMRITSFPKVLAIHLSRSIFDRSSSTKNAAKVSFPERLPLGSLLDRKWYRLLGIVCHKGNHHGGHYESFRRNHVYPPFSTPDVFKSYAQSRSPSENPSAMPSPKLTSKQKPSNGESSSPHSSTEPGLSPASSSSTSLLPPASLSPRPSSSSTQQPSPTGLSSDKASLDLPSTPNRTSSVKSSRKGARESLTLRRKKQPNNRWWRISDEKVKECKTNDVLAMQREVYLLFYELERPGDDAAL